MRGFDLLFRADRYRRVVLLARHSAGDGGRDDDGGGHGRVAPWAFVAGSGLLQAETLDRWTLAELLQQRQQRRFHERVLGGDRPRALEGAILRVVVEGRKQQVVIG